MAQTPRNIIDDTVTEATGQKIQSIRRITSGEINEVYDVALSDGAKVIVRISRRVDSQELQREEWAIHQGLALGLPVPKLIFVKDRLDLKEPLAFSVHKRIEGKTLSSMMEVGDVVTLEKTMNQLGEILAQVHTIKTEGFGWLDASGRAGYRSLAEYFDEITANTDRYTALADIIGLDRQIIDKAISLLSQDRDIYSQVSDSCLTHADFSPNNIIVNNENVTGIIDWGLASGGCPAFDVAHWDYALPDRKWATTTQWLIDGYTVRAKLEDNFLQLKKQYQIRLALIRVEWYASQENQRSLDEHKHKLIEIVSA